MKCPYCGALESRVVDSRGLEEEVRRRRVCSTCGVRFTTSERVQSHALSVVKKDGRREEYDREKLASGIWKACEKRPLPTVIRGLESMCSYEPHVVSCHPGGDNEKAIGSPGLQDSR